MVTATSVSGDAIGGASGTLSLNGNGVVFVKPSYVGELSVENGILFNGNTAGENINAGYDGTVYGDVPLLKDLNLSRNETLSIPAGTRLTVPDGVTLKNGGTIAPDGEIYVPQGGTFIKGNLTGEGTVTLEPTLGGDGDSGCNAGATALLCGALALKRSKKRG